MTSSTRRTLSDSDGYTVTLVSCSGPFPQSGTYVRVDGEGEFLSAGPFTRAQLDELLHPATPVGRSTGPHLHHTAQTYGSYTRTAPDPDDMDGGVTAALIEKEALSGASLAAHFRDKRDMERARAEKAEKERDEVAEDRDRVFDLVRDADMHRDLANERAERAERERDEARAELDLHALRAGRAALAEGGEDR